MAEFSSAKVVMDIQELSKTYGTLKAVDCLNLQIFHGEVFALLGPNGAGKTTTIKMICGLLKSDSGHIMIDDHPLKTKYRACRKMIGLCPQELVIWESLTCKEQLEFMAGLYDINHSSARQNTLKLLKILGLLEKRNKLAKTLSGGMKRRLNIALAMVHDPEILILDEPQAGLDPQSRILVREYIRTLSEHKTIILTTHDMDEADRLADRVAIIDHGRLLVLDKPGQLKNRIGEGDLLEIKIDKKNEDQWNKVIKNLPVELEKLSYHNGTIRLVALDMVKRLPQLMSLIKKNNLEIEDLTVRKKTLEDVFISLTGRRLRE